MKSRTRKLLSLLLATAMVFTMNTFAFGEELADVDSVIYEEDDDVDSTTDPDADEDDGDDDPYYPTITTPANFALDGAKKLVVTLTESTDKKKKTTVVKLENVTDPVSWNQTRDGETLMETVFSGGKAEDDYLYMGKKVHVSDNGSAYGIVGLRSSWNTNQDNVSYNVINLDGGNYLFMRYYVYDLDADYEDDDSIMAARVEGYNYPIPVIMYDGRKIDFNKSGKSKANGKSKEAINIAAALVKYENGTVTSVPGITVGKVTVDKKNNQNASVSWGMIGIVKDKVVDHYEYPKVGEIPTFTFAVKATGDAKSMAKTLKDKLKNEKYPFAILQLGVVVNSPDFYIYYDQKTHRYHEFIEKRALSTNFPEAGFYYRNEDHSTGSAYTTGNTLYISKLSSKGGNVSMYGYTWNGKKSGETEIKVKAKTEYTFTAGKMGGEDVLVLDFPGKNIVYGEGLGNVDGYKYAFRVSPTDKKLLRQGVYKADNDGFVYSED